MKKLIFATAAIAFSITCQAEKIEDSVIGTVDLAKLRSSASFMLSERYEGDLSLKIGSADTNHHKTIRRVFNCFTHDGSGFSDADQPTPNLPAIYQGTSVEGRGIGIVGGHIAFLDHSAHSNQAKLEGIKTLEEFREVLPKAVPKFFEPARDGDPKMYWYSWANIGDEGTCEVHFVEVEQSQQVFKLWVWHGNCKPAKATAKPAAGKRAPFPKFGDDNESGEWLAVPDRYVWPAAPWDAPDFKPEWKLVEELTIAQRKAAAACWPYDKFPNRIGLAEIDLNQDGNDEILVNVPAFGGTGGAYYEILTPTKKGYKSIGGVQGGIRFVVRKNKWWQIEGSSRGGGGLYTRFLMTFEDNEYRLSRNEAHDFNRGKVTVRPIGRGNE